MGLEREADFGRQRGQRRHAAKVRRMRQATAHVFFDSESKPRAAVHGRELLHDPLEGPGSFTSTCLLSQASRTARWRRIPATVLRSKK